MVVPSAGGDDGPMRRALVAVAVVAGMVGCGSSAAPKAGPDQVVVAHFAFTPTTLTVPPGTTVTWEFDEAAAPHNVYQTGGPGGLGGFSSTYQRHGTFRHTFAAAGTYTYVCQLHPYMRGTVVVSP